MTSECSLFRLERRSHSETPVGRVPRSAAPPGVAERGGETDNEPRVGAGGATGRDLPRGEDIGSGLSGARKSRDPAHGGFFCGGESGSG